MTHCTRTHIAQWRPHSKGTTSSSSAIGRWMGVSGMTSSSHSLPTPGLGPRTPRNMAVSRPALMPAPLVDGGGGKLRQVTHQPSTPFQPDSLNRNCHSYPRMCSHLRVVGGAQPPVELRAVPSSAQSPPPLPSLPVLTASTVSAVDVVTGPLRPARVFAVVVISKPPMANRP